MLIQEYLPGTDGEDALTRLDPEARAVYFRDWGAAVGQMHSVQPPCFSASISEPEQCRPTWAVMVEERLRRTVALNREACVIPEHRLELASDQILAGGREISRLVQPSLIHGDLYPPNTLLNAGRFSAMLDFEHAKAWDPVHYFVKLEMWTFERYASSKAPFLVGYRLTAPTTESFEARLRVCVGLELLSGFPYWKRHGDDAMLEDYRARFDRWLRA